MVLTRNLDRNGPEGRTGLFFNLARPEPKNPARADPYSTLLINMTKNSPVPKKEENFFCEIVIPRYTPAVTPQL